MKPEPLKKMESLLARAKAGDTTVKAPSLREFWKGLKEIVTGKPQ
jgi:hypothetical protein